MNLFTISPNTTLKQQAKNALAQNNYIQASLLYEQLVILEPEQISHVWYFGLTQFLLGQEQEAQFTWMIALSEATPDVADEWTETLVEILRTAAEDQEQSENWSLAWAIRQNIHGIAPLEIHNILNLVHLSTRLNLFDGDYLEKLELTELLRSQSFPNLDHALLLTATEKAIESWFEDPRVKELTDEALKHLDDAEILNVFVDKAFKMKSYGQSRNLTMACYLAEICLRYVPNDIDVLRLLATCYEVTGFYVEAVEAARRAVEACITQVDRLTGIGFLCVRLLKTGACWQEVSQLFSQQKELVSELIQYYVFNPDDPLDATTLTFCSFYPQYLADNPIEHRRSQNQLAELVQRDLRLQAHSMFEKCQKQLSMPPNRMKRKLKIGYIARHMEQHSVGWLARWLMQYHDRDRFEIYTYHLHMKQISEFTDLWFVQSADHSARFDDGTWAGVATHICENDKIDILVELDSVTYSDTCSIMAMKPAPIQVSWLGFDASGIPAVDYFLADPYVLPESAQEYYTEKIWRLPNTYLAVDGFEVGFPTLRRDQMNIPTDAVVYLCVQDGRKRHPETMRLQVKILREVPNSHLLIKGAGDNTSFKEAFLQIAEEEGVELSRLHFLSRDRSEYMHRANLGIADIVLDTYPYNGATTTLETLWTGLPLVTRVGQQWASRNSYTMLINAQITEGIAWTDEEYLEWGVRLGRDRTLRQDIRMRLLQSRHTAPLWNTRQFARDIEGAYEQMWQVYLQQRG
jgi:predicted O-linked N-acetylglucosamine transferase (SPINDLY family)